MPEKLEGSLQGEDLLRDKFSCAWQRVLVPGNVKVYKTELINGIARFLLKSLLAGNNKIVWA